MECQSILIYGIGILLALFFFADIVSTTIAYTSGASHSLFMQRNIQCIKRHRWELIEQKSECISMQKFPIESSEHLYNAWNKHIHETKPTKTHHKTIISFDAYIQLHI